MSSILDSGGGAKWQSATPIVSLLLAGTLWGTFWYPLRWLEQLGLDGLWQTFFIYSGTLWVVVLVLWRRASTLKQELACAPWALLFMALASGWCNTAFILAMLEGEVMRVLLLFYLSPLWATLIAWLFLKETLHPRSMLVLAIAISGAVIMLWQPGMGYPWPHGTADWMALSAGISFAILNSLVRFTGQVSVPIKTVVAWTGAIAVSLGLIFVTGTGLPEVGAAVIGYAGLIGALVMVIMTFSVVYGVTHMPVHRSSVILLFELVAGAVSAFFLTSEVMETREWVGGLLVIAAAWLSASSQMQHPDEELKT